MARWLERISRRLNALDMRCVDDIARDLAAGVALDIDDTAQELGAYAERLRALHDSLVAEDDQRRLNKNAEQRRRWREHRRSNGNS
jgi:hypothetical protein